MYVAGCQTALIFCRSAKTNVSSCSKWSEEQLSFLFTVQHYREPSFRWESEWRDEATRLNTSRVTTEKFFCKFIYSSSTRRDPKSRFLVELIYKIHPHYRVRTKNASKGNNTRSCHNWRDCRKKKIRERERNVYLHHLELSTLRVVFRTKGVRIKSVEFCLSAG